MADDPRTDPDALELSRVRSGSGLRWVAAWIGLGLVVVTVAVLGADLRAAGPTPQALADTATPQVAEVVLAASSARASAAPLPAIDITSGASGYAAAFEARRRRSIPLIIESTDFHANGGAAYYGIGGKLLRALGPTPSPTTSPNPATP